MKKILIAPFFQLLLSIFKLLLSFFNVIVFFQLRQNTFEPPYIPHPLYHIIQVKISGTGKEILSSKNGRYQKRKFLRYGFGRRAGVDLCDLCGDLCYIKATNQNGTQKGILLQKPWYGSGITTRNRIGDFVERMASFLNIPQVLKGKNHRKNL